MAILLSPILPGRKRETCTETMPATKGIECRPMPFRYEVSPGYFAAAGTGLLAGRDLSWRETKAHPRWP